LEFSFHPLYSEYPNCYSVLNDFDNLSKSNPSFLMNATESFSVTSGEEIQYHKYFLK